MPGDLLQELLGPFNLIPVIKVAMVHGGAMVEIDAGESWKGIQCPPKATRTELIGAQLTVLPEISLDCYECERGHLFEPFADSQNCGVGDFAGPPQVKVDDHTVLAQLAPACANLVPRR